MRNHWSLISPFGIEKGSEVTMPERHKTYWTSCINEYRKYTQSIFYRRQYIEWLVNITYCEFIWENLKCLIINWLKKDIILPTISLFVTFSRKAITIVRIYEECISYVEIELGCRGRNCVGICYTSRVLICP